MKPIPFVLAALFSTLPLLADSATYPAWDGKESIPDYAKRAHLDPTLTLDLGNGVTCEFVLIPAGQFLMGSPKGEPKTADEAKAEQQHTVTLTQPFYLAKLELTQAQYEKVVGSNPSVTKQPDLPVHNVTWQNAHDFCEKLSKQSGRDVRLPTEAQWEYACRAGTTTPYPNGSTIADLDKIAWFGANSGGKPHKGAEKSPNPWGLYDMLGNIREFTSDLYSTDPQQDAADPTGPTTGDEKNHVVRGAAYTANAALALNCRSASRRPTESLKSTGFRILIAVPPK